MSSLSADSARWSSWLVATESSSDRGMPGDEGTESSSGSPASSLGSGGVLAAATTWRSLGPAGTGTTPAPAASPTPKVAPPETCASAMASGRRVRGRRCRPCLTRVTWLVAAGELEEGVDGDRGRHGPARRVQLVAREPREAVGDEGGVEARLQLQHRRRPGRLGLTRCTEDAHGDVATARHTHVQHSALHLRGIYLPTKQDLILLPDLDHSTDAVTTNSHQDNPTEQQRRPANCVHQPVLQQLKIFDVPPVGWPQQLLWDTQCVTHHGGSLLGVGHCACPAEVAREQDNHWATRASGARPAALVGAVSHQHVPRARA
mmetsp:Transcript_6389/g.18995  ORF Transcript_6389/g.18995 Transcript_6389/m.18995 type:complete len:318 (+) Transcript_6389:182-1135(+)